MEFLLRGILNCSKASMKMFLPGSVGFTSSTRRARLQSANGQGRNERRISELGRGTGICLKGAGIDPGKRKTSVTGRPKCHNWMGQISGLWINKHNNIITMNRNCRISRWMCGHLSARDCRTPGCAALIRRHVSAWGTKGRRKSLSYRPNKVIY